jgi:hypothetical protein
MSQQSPQKVLDRIMNYPHKEKGCSYICGPHLDPCVMVRAHDGDCECRECHQKQCSHPMAARKLMSPVDRSEKCRLCGLVMRDV